MAQAERELPKSLYVSPSIHWRASVAAATLGMTLKEMTEAAITDFIAKHNLATQASVDPSVATK